RPGEDSAGGQRGRSSSGLRRRWTCTTGCPPGAEELDGVGDDLEAAAALAVPALPFVGPELPDDGDLPAFGEPFGAGGGQLVEGEDVDEVGDAADLAGHGEAEGGGLVLLGRR